MISCKALDRILEALRIGETTDWEFKSARGGFPGSFWETYSGMANAEGGVVVLGVRETEAGAQLDGLTAEQIERYQKTLWDGLNNRGQVSRNLLDPGHVEVVEVEGARVLAIRIPRATRVQRPVYLGGNPFGHTWRRRHEGDYRCDDGEVRRMLADADPTPADHRILHGFSLEDLDPSSLRQYRQRLRVSKGDDHPWIALEDRELLQRLGGWRKDRVDGREGVTMAGLLMFGKDLPIRDSEGVPGYFVDYRERLDPTTRWSDRIYPDGTWEPNLFQFYTRVWPKLAAGITTPFCLDGDVRKDITPAHEALREAFVNALIHSDYAVAGGVVIERFPDRFVFENPGTLLVSLEQYHRGGVSECRNIALQQMFLMIGGGEKSGSGADKIRSGWSSRHWRTPRITMQVQPDRVRLELPMVSFIPEDTLTRLRGYLGDEFNRLTKEELQALATADIESAVSNARLQELLTYHPVDISRMLARLCERGWLVSDNRRRWTTYRLGSGPSNLPLFDAVGASHLTEDSGHLTEDSGHLPGDSGHLPPDPLVECREQARSIASSGKVKPAQMRSVIAALCTDRYLSAQQLADLVRRNADGLRKRFLMAMVREGVLRLRYPETPNRPDQAYTAVKKS